VLCPVTVKKAMERVCGVRSVQIDLAARTATVVFDPSATTVGAIAASSADAGYPATVKVQDGTDEGRRHPVR
jgi:mercuric ion binding protein